MWDEVTYNHTSCLESIVNGVWTLPPCAQIAQSINLHPLLIAVIAQILYAIWSVPGVILQLPA